MRIPSANSQSLLVALCAPQRVGHVSKHVRHLVHEAEWAQSRTYVSRLRQVEYLLARAAFHVVTKNPMPLLNSSRGAPIWPDNVTGSIAHLDGNVVLALTRNGIPAGIDIESSGQESFSCREAAYKMIYGLDSDLIQDRRCLWDELSVGTLPGSDGYHTLTVFLGPSAVARCAIARAKIRDKRYAVVIAVPPNTRLSDITVRVLHAPLASSARLRSAIEPQLNRALRLSVELGGIL